MIGIGKWESGIGRREIGGKGRIVVGEVEGRNEMLVKGEDLKSVGVGEIGIDMCGMLVGCIEVDRGV